MNKRIPVVDPVQRTRLAIYQRYTIWTLYDSLAKLGSLLFQKIALSVSFKNLVGPFIEKKALEIFRAKGEEIKATIEEILKLFGENDCINVIDS
ncbi:hypothetical protein MFLAVUS_007703 [Mucor flavus]|uniref:Uncharacterized protein n=1 Tax=Mucor flavus TaxID=439312 RepID=A0ABP9Z520_9FUNG